MKVEEITNVVLDETGPRPVELSVSPYAAPMGALEALLWLKREPSLFSGQPLSADIFRLRAFLDGLAFAFEMNGLRDEPAEKFFAWLRDQKGLVSSRGWDSELLQQSGGDHARAIARLLELAEEFSSKHPPKKRELGRYEPGWAAPPTPPFFVKLHGSWHALPDLATLQVSAAHARPGRSIEAFDSTGRILRVHLRPDRKLASELARKLRSRARVELVKRRVPKKMLDSAVAALERARSQDLDRR